MDARARAELSEQLRRLADGDRSAFEPAYATLWPLVRAFCSRVLAADDAEDAAQLALMKVFDRAASFDPEREALPWVLAIAAWECRTIRKRRLRAREIDDAPLAREADGAPSAEARLLEREVTTALGAALAALAPADRETLERTIAGDAPALVAAPTFRKRRERAVARLKEAWRRVHGD